MCAIVCFHQFISSFLHFYQFISFNLYTRLSVSLDARLSLSLDTCLCVSLDTCLSVCLDTCLSVSQSRHLSVYLCVFLYRQMSNICLSLCLHVWTHLSVRQSVCVPVQTPVCLPACLSGHISVSHHVTPSPPVIQNVLNKSNKMASSLSASIRTSISALTNKSRYIKTKFILAEEPVLAPFVLFSRYRPDREPE